MSIRASCSAISVGLLVFIFLISIKVSPARCQETRTEVTPSQPSGLNPGAEGAPIPPPGLASQSATPPVENAPVPARSQEPQTATPPPVLFSLSEIRLEGNTLIPQEKLEALISPFLGDQKGFSDIEKVRGELEKAYHDAGYPTVLVIVPEQTIENQMIRMQVIEGKLDRIEITGNRYFTVDHILKRLPSLKLAVVPYEPDVENELAALNLNPDLLVTPVLSPGEEPGKVDLQLNVKDHPPVHGSLEWNNRQSPNTPEYRLNGSLQHTNFFDRDHTITLTTTQSPDDFGQVQVNGLSYAVPVTDPKHLLIAYGMKSVSKSLLNGSALPNAGNVNVMGNSTIFGLRYLFPLGAQTPPVSRQLSVGIEYKQQGQNNVLFPGTIGSALLSDPVNYLPISMTYTGTQVDRYGSLRVSLTLKGNRAGIVPDGGAIEFGGNLSNPNYPVEQPGNRKGATGNFAIFQAGSEILRYLPNGFDLSLKGEGQAATEPLIPAEEFFGGGVDSVRGYLENEALGDNGLRGSIELMAPRFPHLLGEKMTEEIRLTFFLDAATLLVKNPSPGQTDHFDLEGTGIGLRVKLTDYFQASFDQAWALQNGPVTQKGSPLFHFSIKTQF